MDIQNSRAILRRVGIVLSVIGILDIAFMVYCIVNSLAYSSSFNIFALVLGIFLIRGNLRAASIVRFFVAFFIGCLVSLIAAMPFLQPPSLTWAELHHFSLFRFTSCCFITTVLFWIVIELNRRPVLEAFEAAGRKVWSPLIPVIIGFGLTVVVSGTVLLATGSETGKHAEELAVSKLGPGYKYHLTSLHVLTFNGGKSVAAIVTAWNDNMDIQEVPIKWDEE